MDIFQTERLVFRKFTQRDINNLFILLSNPHVMKYCCGPIDIDGTKKWLNMIIDAYKRYGYDYWAVYEKTTNDFVGQIGILNQEVDGRQLNCLAYMIDPKHWNKGYATEGAIATRNYAFNVLNMKNLVATVECENLQSICVLRKIGMKYECEIKYNDNKLYVYSMEKVNIPF